MIYAITIYGEPGVFEALPKDRQDEEALRRKGFTGWMDIGDPGFVIEPSLTERTTALFGQLMPVFKLLSRIKQA